MNVYCRCSPWHLVAQIRTNDEGQHFLVRLTKFQMPVTGRQAELKAEMRERGAWRRRPLHETSTDPSTYMLAAGRSLYGMADAALPCRNGKNDVSLAWLGDQVPLSAGPIVRVALPQA